MSASDRKTILLVEDDALIAMSEKKELEKCGYSVITANSGEKALEVVSAAGAIDLILMDIDLGNGMDGAETATLILQSRMTPIVFLSSHTEPEIVDRTEKITSYGYVVKSANISVLDASIKMAFKLFEANQKIQVTNEMFQKVLDSIPQFICWKNRNSEFLGCNKNFATMAGLQDTQSIIGKTDWDLPWKKEETEHFIEDDGKVMSMDAPKYNIIEPASAGKGYESWLDTNKVPLHDAEGRVNGILVSFSDITESKLIEDSLAQEQYLRETLMNSSSDYIFFKDRDCRFIMANEAIARYFGLDDPEEMIGKTDFDFFPESYARQKYEEEQKIIKTGMPITKEEGQVANNHPPAWVFLEKWPLRDKDGNIIGTFGFSRDITERKQNDEKITNLLKEKETILKEVNHRIKNNMTIINSLLALQASALSESSAIKALEDAGSRVQSMMVLYEKLFQSSNFTDVSIKEYLSDLVDRIIENFPNGSSIKIEKSFEDFILDSKIVSHLGLIVNELLTNIMKYAFMARKTGRVGISAARIGGRVTLIIEDNGDGMPEGIDFKNSTGFGLMLVGMLTEQLEGTIRIERGEGTRIILEFEE
jgi:PAS domain S-box-containing protein